MHSSFLSSIRSTSAVIALIALAVITPSLSVKGGVAHAQVAAPTCVLSASPSTVAYNGSTTLSWYTTDATSRTITDIGFVMTSGIQPIYNITSSKTYVMTVSGPGGTSTCQTTVNVSSQASYPTCSISASNTDVGYGGSTNISWNSSNAYSASLTDYGNVGTTGSQYVGPIYSTRTFVLNVSGVGGNNSCQVTVYAQSTNQNVPTCNLDASQTTVTSGQGVSLFWNTSGAYSNSINTIGSVNTSGSQMVYPYTTTTYVLTSQGTGGSTTCTRTVYVQSSPVYTNSAPTCSLSATSPVVNYGGTTTLTWNTTNGYSVSIDNSLGVVQNNGSYIIGNITGTRTYTLTVVGTGGTRTCQTTVSTQGYGYSGSGYGGVSSTAPTCGMSVQPDGKGGYLLGWYTQNALLASIAGIGSVGKSGTYAITPVQNTVYTMTVRGYDGSERTCQTTAALSPISGIGNGGGYGGVYYGGSNGGYGNGGYGYGGSGGGVPLNGVPYTGAEDYVYPLFIAAFMLTAFYGAVQAQKKIRFA